MKNPLISVIIVTYNSSKYVIEALESVKNQTYINIELIISDDASSDNTIEICKKWIDCNRARFAQTQILTSIINTGTVANCKRALHKINGEWIKFLGGDDYLLKNCIELNISYVEKHVNARVVFSGVNVYNEAENSIKYQYSKRFYLLSSKKQYKYLLRRNDIFSLSLFVQTKTLRDIGGFNENYIFLEDRPLWLTMTRLGIRLFGYPTPTCVYRRHENNISRSKNIINDSLLGKDSIRFDFNEIIPESIKNYLFINVLIIRIKRYIERLIIKNGNVPNNINLLLCRVTESVNILQKVILRIIIIIYSLNLIDDKHSDCNE